MKKALISLSAISGVLCILLGLVSFYSYRYVQNTEALINNLNNEIATSKATEKIVYVAVPVEDKKTVAAATTSKATTTPTPSSIPNIAPLPTNTLPTTTTPTVNYDFSNCKEVPVPGSSYTTTTCNGVAVQSCKQIYEWGYKTDKYQCN